MPSFPPYTVEDNGKLYTAQDNTPSKQQSKLLRHIRTRRLSKQPYGCKLKTKVIKLKI